MLPISKPVVKGPVDGNAYAVIGATCEALKRAGLKEQAVECKERCLCAKSYDELLVICMSYVDFDL